MPEQDHDYESDIIRGDAVERFLNDPSIQEVFAKMDQMYFSQWISSEAPADREMLWAKARSLRELGTGLHAMKDLGVAARHAQEQSKKTQL